MIVAAPHHVSKTPSTPAFVKAIHPRYVLFPTNYYNRYHFPIPSRIIVDRYRHEGTRQFMTAKEGAICIRLSSDDRITIEAANQQRYFWQRR